MDEDIIQDFKQFIAATVTQQTSDIRGDISDVRQDIKKLDTKLSAKIDDLSQSVGQAMIDTDEATDAQLKNHERRITKLEQKVA